MKTTRLRLWGVTSLALLAVTSLSSCTDDNDPVVIFPPDATRDDQLTAGACIRLGTVGTDSTSVTIVSIVGHGDGTNLVEGRSSNYKGTYVWTCSTSIDSESKQLEASMLSFEFTKR